MADTVDYLATVVDLPQFALGVVLVATMDHQVFHYDAKTRANTKRIFYELMGLHKTPFTSTESGDYMQ